MDDSSIEIAMRNGSLQTSTCKNLQSILKLRNRNSNVANKNDLFGNFSKLSVDSVQSDDSSHFIHRLHTQPEGVLVKRNFLSDFSKENVSDSSYFCINSTPVEDRQNICIESISLSPIGFKEVSSNEQNIRFASRVRRKRSQIATNVSKKPNKKNTPFSCKKEISANENKSLLIPKQYNDSRTCRIRKIVEDDYMTNNFNKRSEESSSKVTQQKTTIRRSFGSKYKLKSSLKNPNLKISTESKSVRFNEIVSLLNSLNEEFTISEESLESFRNGRGPTRNLSGITAKLKRKNCNVTSQTNKGKHNVDLTECFINTKKKKMWNRFAHFFQS